MLIITRDNNNMLDDLMIRGRDKRRNNIYKYFVGSNRANGRRELHRVGPEYLKFKNLVKFY